MVVLMRTGGQALEDYAANRAREELNALLERAPVLAHRLRPDGSVQDAPVEAVRPGGELMVRSAEVVPVDGELVGADADFDESSVTRESLPVTRRAGEPVLSGTLVMSDRVREDAAATMADLTRLGVREVLVLSGDARATVEHVAAALGISPVLPECLPEDKVRAVRDAPERPVLMVGDGVNDAPVLAAAEVGVAMGARGATAASESADVVVLTEDLARTAGAVRIGRRTVQVALQSIWLGIALSVVLMLVAATGAIPATVGALSQEVVALLAILNALRALGGPRRERGLRTR